MFKLKIYSRHYECLSTETKLTSGIENGSTLTEIDTGDEFIFNGAAWGPKVVQTSIVGSLADVQEVTISSGVVALSGEIELKNQLFAIEMPENWVTANLTLQASSVSGGTFKDVVDDLGREVEITVAPNKIVVIDVNAMKIAPLKYVKFRSGTSAVPVNQTVDRVLHILGKA